jgi:hypothetical protein
MKSDRLISVWDCVGTEAGRGERRRMGEGDERGRGEGGEKERRDSGGKRGERKKERGER